ncbi:MAG: class I SAM-dependent methyltransferase [Ferruginibacter sp.]|nr:class I SAM-dependent methyltransferase [Ferruginibacter sp.]
MKKACSSFAACKEEKKLLLVKKGFPIKECTHCGHRFTQLKEMEGHLDKVYSDEYFFGGKDGYPGYLLEKDLLLKSGINYAKIISKYTKPGKLLDVGCAAGFIMKGFEQSGWDCYGVEPNNTMAEYGRKELNLTIQTGSLEDYTTDIKFDLVNLIQVVGSLYDPDKSLSIINSLLNKDGLVLVESWNMKSIAARIAGKYWHEYCPPSVITWFSDKTLSQMFEYYGFQLHSKGRPVKKININHGLSLVGESTPNLPLKKPLLKLLSKAIGKYNMRYPAVDLKWYLFKKI